METADQNVSLTEDQQNVGVATFRAVTAVDNDEDARTMLQLCDWDLDRAVTTFLDDPDLLRADPIPDLERTPHQTPQPPTETQPLLQPTPAHPLPQSQAESSANRSPARPTTNRFQVPRWFLALFSPFRFVWSFFSNITTQLMNFLSGPAHLIEASPGSTPARQFLSFYESRHGNVHPTFFDGPYTSALSACNSQLKFMLVYIHSESHRLTPAFCRTIMQNDQFIDLANSSYITWAASVTQPEGAAAHHALRAPALPFLAVVAAPTRASDSTRVSFGSLLAVRAGPSALTGGGAATVNWLSRVQQRHAGLLDGIREQRLERESARLLRQEQDEEFAASLEADRRKAREAEQERVREQTEQQRLDDVEVRRERKRQALGEEPEKGPGIASVMVRLPNGCRIGRRFSKDDALEKLFDWAEVNGVDIEVACLVMAYPRKTFLYPEDAGTSIEHAGLFPSCMLLLEERDT